MKVCVFQLVTDITNTAVLENRRNTISLGDDPALAAGEYKQ